MQSAKGSKLTRTDTNNNNNNKRVSMISRSRLSLANISPSSSSLMGSLGHRQGSQGDISRALFAKVKGASSGGRRGSAMAVMQRADETAIKSQQVLGLRNDDWNR